MAEPETELEPTVTEHINPRDAVNDDVRAAITSLKGDASEPAATEGAEPEASATPEAEKPERVRGPDGKFLPKSAETEAAPEKAAPDTKLPATEEQTKASAAPSTAPAPPVSWAADAKQAWASLPPAIQTAVLKREKEASDGFAQYSEKTKAYERALAPVAQEAQRRGLSVEDGIKRLLDGERFLSEQPAQAILWLAQRHGLDLAEIASNPPAPQMPVRSEAVVPPQVLQQVSSLEERLNNFFVDQNRSHVDAFAADPKNPHFNEVLDDIPDMMAILKGRDPSLNGLPLLQKAYDWAVRSNDGVQAKIEAERLAKTQQATQEKVAAKAIQSARAAVSIKGSSADTRPPAKPTVNGDTVYDSVRASINQLRAGI